MIDPTEHRFLTLERQAKAFGKILDRIQARLTQLEARVETLKSNSELARDIDQIRARLGATEVRLDAVETTIACVKANLETHLVHHVDEEPTGYETYTDAELLAEMSVAYDAGRINDIEGAFTEAARRAPK